MILIGMYTKSQVDRQWATLGVLSGHFLDLVSGLPTLKVFGRAKSQVAAIRAVGDRYRSSTMGVLRVSFLSSLALELLATLSVALVAVSVGLRLAEGQIVYSVALFVLLLAPEAYLPLRALGRFAPNYPETVTTDRGEIGIADCLVPQQGPNYALAKRLQRWRAAPDRLLAGTALSPAILVRQGTITVAQQLRGRRAGHRRQRGRQPGSGPLGTPGRAGPGSAPADVASQSLRFRIRQRRPDLVDAAGGAHQRAR